MPGARADYPPGLGLCAAPCRRSSFPLGPSQGTTQLARVVKPAYIADLGREGHRDQKRGAAHRLVGFAHRRHRPTWHDRDQLLLKAPPPRNRILDRIDPVLEDDLLSGMLERLAGQPAPMRQCPMAAAAVDPAMAQQKREQLLPLTAQIVRCRFPCPDEVADRLVD